MIKEEAFYFLGAALLAGVVLEIVWPRIIIAYFNLNWLLALWLASGIVVLRKR